jgi:hypothetical protein
MSVKKTGIIRCPIYTTGAVITGTERQEAKEVTQSPGQKQTVVNNVIQ